MDWAEVASAAAAWAAILAGYGYWRHTQITERDKRAESIARETNIRNEAALREAERKMLVDINAFRSQTEREHTAVINQILGLSTQIKDIVHSLADNYVGRRENDIEIRSISSQLIDVRKDIGALSVQLGSVQERIDELYAKVEFRKAPR